MIHHLTDHDVRVERERIRRAEARRCGHQHFSVCRARPAIGAHDGRIHHAGAARRVEEEAIVLPGAEAELRLVQHKHIARREHLRCQREAGQRSIAAGQDETREIERGAAGILQLHAPHTIQRAADFIDRNRQRRSRRHDLARGQRRAPDHIRRHRRIEFQFVYARAIGRDEADARGIHRRELQQMPQRRRADARIHRDLSDGRPRTRRRARIRIQHRRELHRIDALRAVEVSARIVATPRHAPDLPQRGKRDAGERIRRVPDP